MVSKLVTALSKAGKISGKGKQSFIDYANAHDTDPDTLFYAYVENNMQVDDASNGKTATPEFVINTPDMAHDYLSAVALKFGYSVMAVFEMRDPLSLFDAKIVPNGGAIEYLYGKPLAPHKYSNEDGLNPYYSEHPEIVAEYFIERVRRHSSFSFKNLVDTQYFETAELLNDFVYMQLQAVLNGMVIDQTSYTQSKIMQAIYLGKLKHTLVYSDDNFPTVYRNAVNTFNTQTADLNVLGIPQATAAEDVVTLTSIARASELEVEVIPYMFSPEVLSNSVEKKFSIGFAGTDLWTYDTDHTITAEDVSSGAVSWYEKDIATSAIGQIIKAGEIAKPSAPGATLKLKGSDIEALILSTETIKLYSQIEGNTRNRAQLLTISNPRTLEEVFHLHTSKQLVIAGGFNALALIKATTTTVAALPTAANVEILDFDNAIARPTASPSGGA